ncbi:hypothetical protein [Yinghuangia soli]|uniref:Uncharacterized protein n=1 Tax=Yinghuangia soli TaxID=2908204 RepID=A0AA41Q5P9_9ACTN|nr:hypothetical protein [Yinghuangia soli]MCF2532039.1 hypothetical protein [Yinghuangia soli]
MNAPRARGRRRHTVPGTLALAAVLAFGAAACGADEDPNSLRDDAERAAEAVRSAADEARSEFDRIKDGVDAKPDTRVGTAETRPDGRMAVPLTVENTGNDTVDFLVLVEFRNQAGEFVDAVLVRIEDVPAGQEGKATAVSRVKLSPEATAAVSRALRH